MGKEMKMVGDKEGWRRRKGEVKDVKDGDAGDKKEERRR